MSSTMHRALRALALGLSLALPASAGEPQFTATVSLLEGSATTQRDGEAKTHALKKDAIVWEGDVVATSAVSKVELTLKDGSVIRVGPASRLQLKSIYFVENQKKYSFKLFFGRIWSKVSALVGNDAKFEIETDNAVAGVRGTTFRVDAKKDHSVLVRVYAGAVAMNSPVALTPEHKGLDKREKVEGPKPVTREQWEKLVSAQMELRVSAKGVPEEPKAFTAADDDSWAKWNQQRDGK
jgi:hypothetical protein